MRYIPSEYVDEESGQCKDLSEIEQKLVNQRNMELVKHKQYFCLINTVDIF